MNTAIYSNSGSYVGIGFAVPVDTVNRVVPQLIAHGYYQRPSLGIIVDDRISQLVTAQLEVEGVLILNVEAGSAAAEAGLQSTRTVGNNDGLIPCDIIQQIDQHAIDDSQSLLDALENYNIGDQVIIRFLRGDEVQQTSVMLE